jgi:hypothetical protein
MLSTTDSNIFLSLVLALADLSKLEDATRRLRMTVSSSSHLLQAHTDLLDRVTHIKNTLCRFSSALSEIMDGFCVYNDLHADRTTPQSLLDHVSALSAKATVLRDGMTALLDDMNLVDVPFLLLRKSHVHALCILIDKTLNRRRTCNSRCHSVPPRVGRILASIVVAAPSSYLPASTCCALDRIAADVLPNRCSPNNRTSRW